MSTDYRNGRNLLRWECNRGHRWRASPERVKGGRWRRGTWCPQCYNDRRRFRAKRSIEEMRDLAIARGGVCESTEYINSKAKLVWRCSKGHHWQALPTSVVQGTWCPLCARNQRLRLSEMQEIAASRGGACLSRTYLNERTALWWRCPKGHEWNARAEKVKRGSWCPVCARAGRRNKWTRKRAGTVADFVESATCRMAEQGPQIWVA